MYIVFPTLTIEREKMTFFDVLVIINEQGNSTNTDNYLFNSNQSIQTTLKKSSINNS